jgi:hypothetical protein
LWEAATLTALYLTQQVLSKTDHLSMKKWIVIIATGIAFSIQKAINLFHASPI